MSRPPSKLRTSRAIYDQIRWDPRLDPARFFIGYESRRDLPDEVPLPDFDPEGEIPWHRVLYVRDSEGMVWDRRSRVDELAAGGRLGGKPRPEVFSGSGSGSGSGEGARAIPAREQEIVVFGFDVSSGQWEPRSVPSAAPPGGSSLSVVSWNVMADRKGPWSPERAAGWISELERADADLIGLEEMTPESLGLLLEQPWVRERYLCTERPGGPLVSPYGQVLLSRVPVLRASVTPFTPHKRLLSARVSWSGGELLVVVVHLTSDRAARAEEIRRGELMALRAHVERQQTALVMGDFNADDDETREWLGDALVDVWGEKRDDAGFTFDPFSNPHASKNTLSGRARRLDRVMLRAARSGPRALSIELMGEAAPQPSDHAGLLAVLASAPEGRGPLGSQGALPVYQSALIVAPPEGLWGPIQAIRRQHDRHLERWMPHVNLLYGFVPDGLFGEAAGLVAEALQDMTPFEVTLASFEVFEHGKSDTLWLRPDDHPRGSLRELQRRLERVFPRCDEQGKKSPLGYVPHLSVGQFPRGEARRKAVELSGTFRPISFRVGQVSLISRRGEEPFRTRYAVSLGTGRYRGEGTSGGAELCTRRQRDEVAEVIERAGERFLREAGVPAAGVPVVWTGSYRLGVDGPGSDLDGVCWSTLPTRELEEGLLRELSAAGALERCKRVSGDEIGVSRLVVRGVRVDLAFARLPHGSTPRSLDAADRGALDVGSRQAIGGLLDTEALARAMTASGAMEAFTSLLSRVRSWARARGIDASWMGYLSGAAWSVMTARCLLDAPAEARADAGAMLRRFFETYASWNGASPVALDPDAHPPERGARPEPMKVFTAGPMPKNAARGVTGGTTRILLDELGRGARLSGQPSLLDPIEVRGVFPFSLELVVEASTASEHDEALGMVQTRLIPLLLALEAAGAGPRPVSPPKLPVSATRSELLVGLSGAEGVEACVASLEESFSSWPGRPAGATLRAAVRKK